MRAVRGVLAVKQHSFDGMSWPLPENHGLEHRLRYGNAAPGDLICAATIVAAYKALVMATNEKRRKVAAELKRAQSKEGQRPLPARHGSAAGVTPG